MVILIFCRIMDCVLDHHTEASIDFPFTLGVSLRVHSL